MDLNDSNFILFAAKHYDNPHCYDMDEFYKDLSTPIHVKKLFTRYHQNGILKDRLLLNHVVSFYNVFSSYAATKILFFKTEKKYYTYLKTVLTYLDRCPTSVIINSKEINLSDISIDDAMLKQLETSTVI